MTDKIKRLKEYVKRAPYLSLNPELRQDITDIITENEEYEFLFDLTRKADQRAIDMWHKAGGDELTHPDSAELIVWVMKENERYRKAMSKIINVSTNIDSGTPASCDEIFNIAQQALKGADDE